MKFRGQVEGIGSFSPCGVQAFNSGPQTWWQVPFLPTESSCCPNTLSFPPTPAWLLGTELGSLCLYGSMLPTDDSCKVSSESSLPRWIDCLDLYAECWLLCTRTAESLMQSSELPVDAVTFGVLFCAHSLVCFQGEQELSVPSLPPQDARGPFQVRG